ncbi:hypothetical protein, partial [Paenibacillus durus]|uniref:hypothetical protein n=1 Tax=Paenibacillus durus TaxID=44251 RepID=UPI001B807019
VLKPPLHNMPGNMQFFTRSTSYAAGTASKFLHNRRNFPADIRIRWKNLHFSSFFETSTPKGAS